MLDLYFYSIKPYNIEELFGAAYEIFKFNILPKE